MLMLRDNFMSINKKRDIMLKIKKNNNSLQFHLKFLLTLYKLQARARKPYASIAFALCESLLKISIDYRIRAAWYV